MAAIATGERSAPGLTGTGDAGEFAERAAAWRRGEFTEEEFKRYRATLGVYAQRQDERYILRVKIPGGALDGQKLRVLAALAERYSRARVHLTTRQNVELHFLTLDDVPAALAALEQVGLTSRESGGNTVRSVTTCPLAGVCPAEDFDVTQRGVQIARRFQGSSLGSGLPRKLKIALSGCAADCAYSRIHDLGAVAKANRGVGGNGVAFEAFVGGGLGAVPRAAVSFAADVPGEALAPLCAALVRTFMAHGDYENRKRARLKFLLEQVGQERLREWVAGEYDRENGERPDWLSGDASPSRESATAPAPTFPPPPDASEGAENVPAAWWRANVVAQRQRDRHTVFVPTPGGSVSARQLRALADIGEVFAAEGIRSTLEQDVLLLGVSGRKVAAVYRALAAEDLIALGGRAGIVACPGAAVCREGLADAQEMARAVERALPEGWQAEPAFAGTRIKISGCQNGCAQPQMGTIGLAGCLGHRQGQAHPAFWLSLGGGVVAGQTAFGRPVAKLPPERVPEAIRGLVEIYFGSRRAGETFAQFMRDSGAPLAARLAQGLP